MVKGMPETDIYSLAAQKGGTGKSTSAQNLGMEFALLGQPTCIVDFDGQCDQTRAWGLDPEADRVTIYEAMEKPSLILDALVQVRPNLWLVPASLDLSGAEIAFMSRPGWDKRLSRTLDVIRGRFRNIFIDCPPALGYLTINALMASNRLIVCVQPQFFSLKAIKRLMAIVSEVSPENPALELTGALITQYHEGVNLDRDVHAAVRTLFGDRVFKTLIPYTVRFSEAQAFGQPISEYQPESKGALAYHQLVQEVMHHAQAKALPQ